MPIVTFLALGAFFCMRTLGLTLRLMCIYFFLFAVYVLLATGLVRKLGMQETMAHALAATLPVAGATLCFVRMRPY